MADAYDIRGSVGDKRRKRGVDMAALVRITESQYGRVSARQLREIGFDPSRVYRWVRDGRLHRVHHGVYALGYRSGGKEAMWMSAVLLGGTGAILSRHAAAGHSGIRRPLDIWPEVAVPRQRRPHPRVIFHTVVLPSDEVTVHEGIPITVPVRTAFDLAPSLSLHQLEWMINEIEVQQLWSAVSLEMLLDRYPRRPGAANLRTILGRLSSGGERIRSTLESIVRGLIHESGLPRPRVNVPMLLSDGDTFTPDFAWPEAKVIVEPDGGRFHGTDLAMERDKGRDRTLAAMGWVVIRVTWRQANEDPRRVIADIQRIIEARTPPRR